MSSLSADLTHVLENILGHVVDGPVSKALIASGIVSMPDLLSLTEVSIESLRVPAVTASAGPPVVPGSPEQPLNLRERLELAHIIFWNIHLNWTTPGVKTRGFWSTAVHEDF